MGAASKQGSAKSKNIFFCVHTKKRIPSDKCTKIADDYEDERDRLSERDSQHESKNASAVTNEKLSCICCCCCESFFSRYEEKVIKLMDFR